MWELKGALMGSCIESGNMDGEKGDAESEAVSVAVSPLWVQFDR